MWLFFLQKSTRLRNAPAKLQAATIHVYDASKMLGISKKLADNYIIDSDNLTGKLEFNVDIHQSYLKFEFSKKCASITKL